MPDQDRAGPALCDERGDGRNVIGEGDTGPRRGALRQPGQGDRLDVMARRAQRPATLAQTQAPSQKPGTRMNMGLGGSSASASFMAQA